VTVTEPMRRRRLPRLRPLPRPPRAMWGCALVAVLSAWVWSVATPTFQPPDEFLHIGYVQYLGETGKIPRPVTRYGAQLPSAELGRALTGVPFTQQGVPTWNKRGSDALHRELDGGLSRKQESGAGAAANNPPLYYLVEAVPYVATKSANLFDRILVMRLFSSLFAGVTAALTFLFLRELMPGTPWAWTVGALAVALQPLHGFVAGAVNPDSLLWAACAGVFLAVARILRRGLTPLRALGLGIALSAGLLTKGAMYGMVPGAILALGFGMWRLLRSERRAALITGAIAVATAALPFVAWLAVKHGFYGDSHTFSTTTTGNVSVGGHGFDLHKELSYVWQLYLPRLPFENDLFRGFPLWDVFFQGFVGRFGHFFFGFPLWVSYLALGVAAALVGLAGRALWLGRAALRRLLPQIACCVAMVGGVALVVGIAGFQFQEREHLGFAQTRYLLLLLPLYGALVALAARGAGRWGRPVGVGLVGLFAAHDLFAVLLTVAHYYG